MHQTRRKHYRDLATCHYERHDILMREKSRFDFMFGVLNSLIDYLDALISALSGTLGQIKQTKRPISSFATTSQAVSRSETSNPQQWDASYVRHLINLVSQAKAIPISEWHLVSLVVGFMLLLIVAHTWENMTSTIRKKFGWWITSQHWDAVENRMRENIESKPLPESAFEGSSLLVDPYWVWIVDHYD